MDQPPPGAGVGQVPQPPRGVSADLLRTVDQRADARAASLNPSTGSNEMLATAEASGDPDLLIVGHRAACVTYFWLGDLNQSREHGDRVLALYGEEKHRHLADIMNTDPKTSVGIYVSLGTWMLGYPDRAVQVSDANDAHARRRGHPFDLGFALTVGAACFGISAANPSQCWRGSRRPSGWAARTVCPLSRKCWRRS